MGLSQQALGDGIGVTQQAVDRYESGAAPAPNVMRRLIAYTAGALTPNDFYAWTPKTAKTARRTTGLRKVARA